MGTVRLNIHPSVFTTTFRKITGITTRFRVIKGSANASKSYSVAQDEILKALKRKEKVLVIRKVASTLKDSIYASFIARLNEFKLQNHYIARLSPLDISLANGSTFIFRGLDDPEKLKSIEGITRIIVEEATELEFDDFKELDRRLRGREDGQMTLLLNPIDETHWIKTHFWDNDWPDATCLTVTYQDNEFVTQTDINRLLALKEYDENQYNIYALAEWGKLKTGSEYFHKFSKAKHVRSVSFIPTLPVITTWDFNVVPYMTCLCAQVSFEQRYINGVQEKFDTYSPGLEPIEVMVLRIYREYTPKPPVNTIAFIGEQFAAEHDPNETVIDYYGDAQGFNRLEGLGWVTRFSLVEDALRPFLHNQSKRAKNPNVNPLRRRDLLNKIFAGVFPDVDIIIDESCTELIDDLINCKLGVKGKIKKRVKNKVTGETYEEHGHCSDALENFVAELLKHLIREQ
ncbi:MAG TPA: PBSX family phage terminase large subunit [Flavisolibacter sp.]|nr:PBSX family phage terminase large subunit [Flavisolibacter sp.]